MSAEEDIQEFLEAQGCQIIENPHSNRWTFYYEGIWWSERINNTYEANQVMNAIQNETSYY